MTRPFRYDLNQIPYNYTVEVTNRFKGLDLTECLKNCGRRFVTLCRGSDQMIPKEKECKKAKWLSGEALQIAAKSREEKSERERERYTKQNTEFQRRARRDKRAFLNEQHQEIEKRQ